jgi:hypothetical protein
VKIRGTAAHIHEKYLALARDSHSSGDRIGAENYLQHAEHYHRLLMTLYPQGQPQTQNPNPQGQVNGGQDQGGDDDAGFPQPHDRFGNQLPQQQSVNPPQYNQQPQHQPHQQHQPQQHQPQQHQPQQHQPLPIQPQNVQPPAPQPQQQPPEPRAADPFDKRINGRSRRGGDRNGRAITSLETAPGAAPATQVQADDNGDDEVQV